MLDGYFACLGLGDTDNNLIVRFFILIILIKLIMKTNKFWKYLAIGFMIAILFGVTLNVGKEVFFINLILGFFIAGVKCMRKDYEMRYAATNYTFPVLLAGVITSILIALSIA